MSGPPPNNAPSLTVVMPVYNAMPYLDEAIQSILAQTYGDFHFAIYDDHSTDSSYECALGWAAKDPRITVTRGDVRAGPQGSAQAAAAIAKSEYIARMDADDVSYPDRLATQMEIMAADPKVALLGSPCDLIDAQSRVIHRPSAGRVASDAPPWAHTSIIYRREAFEKAGGYRTDTDYFEDLDLYRRVAKQGKMLVINRPLVQLRFAAQHARTRDDLLTVIEHVDRQYSEKFTPEATSRKYRPKAFYAIALLPVFALRRPHMVGTMIQHTQWRPLPMALAILGMITIAEISPRLARSTVFLLSKLRFARKARQFREGEVYPWDFPGGSEPQAQP